jgi:hypothetical protein
VLGGFDRGLGLGLAPEESGDLVPGARVGGAVGELGRERGALLREALQIALRRLRLLA